MKYSFLFEQLVRRELRQKYKGSALGVLWYLINPVVLMGAYALVFSVLWRIVDIPDYPLYLIIGLVAWVFFAQALLAAAPSLVLSAPLVRKVRFPREAIPASVATVQLMTFLVMLVLLVPVALAVRGTLEPPLLLLPVIVALLFCMVLGLSLVVSALHAHYRDVEPVIGAALLPLFFVTPIYFRVDDLPGVEDHQLIADLIEWANPIAPFIAALRDVLYSGVVPDAGTLAYLGGAAIVGIVIGLVAFRRLERDLAVIV